MSEVLPRINPRGGGGNKRNVIINASNYPKEELRGRHSVFPRIGGGVSARVVLTNSGISRGGVVRVSAWDASEEKKGIEEAVKRKAAKETEEKRRAAIKAQAEKAISDTEKRLANFLEAAQEMKPLADKVEESAKVEEKAAVIPEEKHEETAVSVEQPRKKRRGRKGKKARAAKMAAEQELS